MDYSLADSATLTFNGGVAGTEGIIHTGIGPFDIEQRVATAYFSARCQKGARRVAFFTNLLTADAANLLSRGADAAHSCRSASTPRRSTSRPATRGPSARSNALTFGGNFRHNTFDISLAPNGDDRNEGGAYMQDEIFFGDQLPLGGRRPRRQVLVDRRRRVLAADDAAAEAGSANSSLRLSFNRAFRAPSFINNHLQTERAQRGEPERRSRRRWRGSSSRSARSATPTSSRRR